LLDLAHGFGMAFEPVESICAQQDEVDQNREDKKEGKQSYQCPAGIE
jgi:hypothetical protein